MPQVWRVGEGMSDIETHVRRAARAKAKVKATARGWSMLSKDEIIALAFIADVFLEDGALPNPAPAKPAPAVISNV